MKRPREQGGAKGGIRETGKVQGASAEWAKGLKECL